MAGVGEEGQWNKDDSDKRAENHKSRESDKSSVEKALRLILWLG